MLLLRAFVVGIIGIAALSMATVTIATVREAYGVYGYTVAPDGVTVGSVTPGYPAARAGLRAGDRIEYSALGLIGRINSVLVREVRAGTAVVFHVDRAGTTHRIAMSARTVAPAATTWIRLCEMLTTLAFLAIGIALVLLRPNAMTWAFLLWGAGQLAFGDRLNGLSQESLAAFIGVSAFTAVIVSIGSAGLLVFVSSFPNATPQPPLRTLARAAVPYGVAIALLAFAQDYYIAFANVPPPAWLNIVCSFVVPVVTLAVASVALLTTLLVHRARAGRVAPVLAGVVLIAVVSLVMTLQAALFTDGTMITILRFASLAASLGTGIAVAYAIVRNRVIEVSFAIGRTLAFTSFNASIVGVLIVLHWLAVNTVAQGSLRFFFEIGGAAAIGVAIPRINTSIGALLDRTIFARRIVAQRQLRQVATAIEYSDDPATIASLVVRQPVEALGLGSAAYFRRDGAGHDFILAASQGWTNEHVRGLASNDLLILSLRAAGGPLNVADASAGRTDFPIGLQAPVLAIPIVVRKRLHGVVLYGAPTDGRAIDAEQFRMLRRIAKAASLAHDRVVQAQLASKAVRELEQCNGARSRFIPDEFLHMLGKDNIAGIQLGDHVEREMTVLFADIRNFTAISEELSPGESFDFLNAYLNRIGPIVREHGGFIDKYIGDSVMALFPAESDAALDAALAVQREVRAFSGTLRAQGKPGIAVGVGLHTGRLMLGTIGERARMETTVISDAVNLASRMESATKIFGAGIVMSEETFAHLARPQNYLVRSLGKLTVRGKRQPVSLYEAYGADAPEIAVRKEASVAQFADAVCRYEEGDWRTAGAAFAELHRLNKDDEVARYFRNRCDALMESSGAGNWDGIERVQAN